MTENEASRLEVLLEEMNGKFSLVLEGHDAIRKEFNVQLDDIKEQQKLFMSLLKGSHEGLKGEIQGVRDELKGEIQGVRDEIKETREELSTEIKAVGDKVNGHEERILFLERRTA